MSKNYKKFNDGDDDDDELKDIEVSMGVTQVLDEIIEDEIKKINKLEKLKKNILSTIIEYDDKNIDLVSIPSTVELNELSKQLKLDANKKSIKIKKKKEKKPKPPPSEPGERETWNSQFDFFLSILGYAVGLGAVWRFPYICYRNGGGVFLIPYFIFLVLLGFPLTFLELAAGQFRSRGPLTCWTIIPIFRGVGLSMILVSTYLAIYYNMIIGYSLYFLVLSFKKVLPWEKCDSKWSSPSKT
jgi:hypothetical protein